MNEEERMLGYKEMKKVVRSKYFGGGTQ